MRPISEPPLSTPVQTVQTSVQTWNEQRRACPDRPNLFDVRTYRGACFIHPSIYPSRSGRFGRSGQTNHGAGFAVQTSSPTFGRSGQQSRGSGFLWLLPVAGRCQRFLRGGLHRGQFGPRFACMSWFQILVPVGAGGSDGFCDDHDHRRIRQAPRRQRLLHPPDAAQRQCDPGRGWPHPRERQ